MMGHLKQVISVFLATLMAMGCTRTIDIPLHQVESMRDPKTPCRVTMRDGTQYRVREFAVTDSTLVIKNLTPSDAYHDKAKLPLVVPLSEVTSVQKSEMTEWFWVGGVAIVVLFVAAAAASQVFSGSD
jgi:hypothetical protein